MQQNPNVGAIFLCDVIQAALANSKLHLFVSGYVPTPTETLAELLAVEATFSGYPAGGYTLGAWGNGLLNPVGGAGTAAPQVDVAYTAPGSGSGVPNNLGGWFLVDATGNLVADGTFASPIGMTLAGDGFPITIAKVEGTLNAIVQCWVWGELQP